jgi:GST-like protein
MDDQYKPEKVWKWDTDNGGKFANINRPTSGYINEAKLPSGDHPFQLYSLATPNGVKVTVMFEELLELGIKDAEYDAYPVNILSGDQFGSDFVDINPNSKIPALLHNIAEGTTRLFESGSILLYLADHFNKFIPDDFTLRAETLNWLFWQMGSAPYLGGGFGHFYAYAPKKIKYCIDRFAMETKRQLDVLDKKLEKTPYISGEEYTIADMAIFPWYGGLVLGELYEAAEFLDVETYTHLKKWAKIISERPAVKRGIRVNKTWGEESTQVPQRHSMADFKS